MFWKISRILKENVERIQSKESGKPAEPVFLRLKRLEESACWRLPAGKRLVQQGGLKTYIKSQLGLSIFIQRSIVMVG